MSCQGRAFDCWTRGKLVTGNDKIVLYLTVGRSRILDVMSCASGQYFSTSWSISQSSFFGPRRPWNRRQLAPCPFVSKAILLEGAVYLLWSQTMPEHVFEDDEEMLQRHVIGVEHTTIFQWRLDQLLHDQFRNVNEITPLDDHRIPCCKNNRLLSQLREQGTHFPLHVEPSFPDNRCSCSSYLSIMY